MLRTDGGREDAKSPGKKILKSPLRRSIEVAAPSPQRKTIEWRDQTRGVSLIDTRWFAAGDDLEHYHECDGRHLRPAADHTPTFADPLLQHGENADARHPAFRQPARLRARIQHEDNIFEDFVRLVHDAALFSEKRARVGNDTLNDRGRLETTDSHDRQPARDSPHAELTESVDDKKAILQIEALRQKIKMLNSGKSEALQDSIVNELGATSRQIVFDGRKWDDRERATDAWIRDGMVHIAF